MRAKTPYVVYTLLGLTVLVFFFQYASEITGGRDIPALLGMKVNQLIIRGQFWRLFTPMLLHGSIAHLLFNMYALNALGPGLERAYGHGRFLALYVLAGFAGNVLSFLFSPPNSLGASTAIFGLLGAEGVFLYQNRQLLGGRARQALTSIVILALINLVIGLFPPIDNWGHVGGLVGGSLFAWSAGPLLGLQGDAMNRYAYDKRGPGDALRAILLVGLLFAAIAAAAIYFRMP
jgi:rhomboid protease GluP